MFPVLAGLSLPVCRSLNSCSCLCARGRCSFPWSPAIDPLSCWSTLSQFLLPLMCVSAVSLQAKPIYGGWLLLAPEGTDFDNPVHRSRVSEAVTSPPRAVGGGGRRSSGGLSLPMEVAPRCTHHLCKPGGWEVFPAAGLQCVPRDASSPVLGAAGAGQAQSLQFYCLLLLLFDALMLLWLA